MGPNHNGRHILDLVGGGPLSELDGGASTSLVEHGVGVAGGFPDVALIY